MGKLFPEILSGFAWASKRPWWWEEIMGSFLENLSLCECKTRQGGGRKQLEFAFEVLMC